MRGWKKHHFIEWGFLVVLLAVCIVLTTLQSRWTGDLGRATTRQQTTQLRGQAQLFCRAFDTQLDEACAQLRPGGEQIDALGRDEAHAQALLRWQADGPRPMFRRLAVAVPENGAARLYLLDQKTARLTRSDWPPEWTALQENLSRHVTGRPPRPFEDPTGFLREYPVFGHGGPGQPGGPGESEWVIMEIDPDYVRQTWLPELTRTYLDPGKDMLHGVAVKTNAARPETLFSTGGEVPVDNGLVSISFNSKSRGGRTEMDDDRDQFWTLYAWPRPGQFAAVVSDARAHDFALACVLDGCLFVGGLLIIHYARRARRVSDARMRFVAAVSHELRTPLTVIRAAGQNLRRGIVREPERVDKYADLIVTHSDQLADMVEQVLSFAGAQRNESTLARKPVSVAQAVQEAIVECAADTQAAGCEVQTTVEGDPPPVLGDAHALRRVFQNLIANAAKHGGRGKRIGVLTRHMNGSSPGCVEVEVTDHGEGIPAREQRRIFEPFFRGSRARGQQIRGSGIGLSVVREIVKVHGGSVRVESQPKQGATFTVSLPAASVEGQALA